MKISYLLIKKQNQNLNVNPLMTIVLRWISIQFVFKRLDFIAGDSFFYCQNKIMNLKSKSAESDLELWLLMGLIHGLNVDVGLPARGIEYPKSTFIFNR